MWYYNGKSSLQATSLVACDLQAISIKFALKKHILSYNLQHVVAHHSLPLRKILSFPLVLTDRAKAGALTPEKCRPVAGKRSPVYFADKLKSVFSCATSGFLPCRQSPFPPLMYTWCASILSSVSPLSLYLHGMPRSLLPQILPPTVVCLLLAPLLDF